MPSFSTEVSHELGQPEAVERLKDFLAKVKERYKDQVSELEGEWQEHILNFKLTTYGFNITGELTVEEELVKLQGQLPFAAVVFRGKIQQSIAGELERALA